MSVLILNALNKEYEIGLKSDKYFETIKGTNLSANLISDCKHLLNGNKPTEINVLSGPGSFTSTRLALVIAKVLSNIWEIPLKASTVMECLETEKDLSKDAQLILDTGTVERFLYDFQTQQPTLKLEKDIDFAKKTITNIDFENQDNLIKLPNLTPLIPQACKIKEIDMDPQPYYSIKPKYLKTETEISEHITI